MAFSFDNHKNLVSSTIANAAGLAGTTIQVASGTGSLFPASLFNCVVYPAGVFPNSINSEIVRVTSRTNDNLTVTRQQESSGNRNIIIGDVIALVVTAKTLTDIESKLVTLESADQAINATQLTAGTLPSARLPALNGDITSVAGSATTTLATVNGSSVGTFGSNYQIPVFQVNAKGLITHVSNTELVATYLYPLNIGLDNSVSGDEAVAMGYANNSTGGNSLTVGWGNVASDDYASALGVSNIASGNHSTAVGQSNVALASYSSCFGYNNTASATFSAAFGLSNLVAGINATAFGYNNEVTGHDTSAVGCINQVCGDSVSVFGHSNQVDSHQAVAVGFNNAITDTDGSYCLAFGYNNEIFGYRSLSMGCENRVWGNNATAVGHFNQIDSIRCGAFGTGVRIAVDGLHEFGVWHPTYHTRQGAVRVHDDGAVEFTVQKTDTAKIPVSFYDEQPSSESNGHLVVSGLGFRVNSNNQLIVEYNDAGTLRTWDIGSTITFGGTATPNGSVDAPIYSIYQQFNESGVFVKQWVKNTAIGTLTGWQ
jgi:hypothetical protein